MGRHLVCGECAATLVASHGGKLQGPKDADAAPDKRIEISLGRLCEWHLGVAQASEVVELDGAAALPVRVRHGPNPTAWAGVRFGPVPVAARDPDAPPPSHEEVRGPAIAPGAAIPLGPVTEIAARLLVEWMRDEPFEAQREGASDAVMVSRAASVARMLLAETRNR